VCILFLRVFFVCNMKTVILDWYEVGVLVVSPVFTVPLGVTGLVWLDAAVGEQVCIHVFVACVCSCI
jgi:hypothetical protein